MTGSSQTDWVDLYDSAAPGRISTFVTAISEAEALCLAHALDDYSPVFLGGPEHERQLLHPAIFDYVRERWLQDVLGAAPGRPGAAMQVVNATYAASEAEVDEPLTVTARCLDRFVKRGRRYIDFEFKIDNACGGLIAIHWDRMLLSYRPVAQDESPNEPDHPAVGPKLDDCLDERFGETQWFYRIPEIDVGGLGPPLFTQSWSVSLRRQARFSEWWRNGYFHRGRPEPLGENLHTDADLAEREGLPSAAVSNPLYTGLLVSEFIRRSELAFLRGGFYLTKSISVVPPGSTLHADVYRFGSNSGHDGARSASSRLGIVVRTDEGSIAAVGDAWLPNL